MSVHLSSYRSCLVSSSHLSRTVYTVKRSCTYPYKLHSYNIHSYINTFTYSYIHTLILSPIHTFIYTSIYTIVHSNINTFKYSYIHAYTIYTPYHSYMVASVTHNPFLVVSFQFDLHSLLSQANSLQINFYLCVKWIACKDPLLPLCQANNLQTFTVIMMSSE
jgi:hypothetical protein